MVCVYVRRAREDEIYAEGDTARQISARKENGGGGKKKERGRQSTKACRGVRGGCARKEKVNGDQLLDR